MTDADRRSALEKELKDTLVVPSTLPVSGIIIAENSDTDEEESSDSDVDVTPTPSSSASPSPSPSPSPSRQSTDDAVSTAPTSKSGEELVEHSERSGADASRKDRRTHSGKEKEKEKEKDSMKKKKPSLRSVLSAQPKGDREKTDKDRAAPVTATKSQTEDDRVTEAERVSADAAATRNARTGEIESKVEKEVEKEVVSQSINIEEEKVEEEKVEEDGVDDDDDAFVYTGKIIIAPKKK